LPSPLTAENEREPVGVHQVNFRKHDDASPDVEEVDDLEVLSRLGHDAFVSRDDQHHGIQPVSAGQHVAHESRVPRHVDDPHLHSAWQAQVCEPEIDGHAAPLFLSQAVWIDPGQDGDQRGLPMVDVASRPDDESHLATFL